MPLDRSETKASLNQGVVSGNLARNTTEKSPRYKELDRYDNYYESKQYDKLAPWHEQRSCSGEYVPIRKRKPSIIYNLPQLLVDRASSKLAGSRSFPEMSIPDDEATQELMLLLVKQSKLQVKGVDYAREFLKSGGVFIKFSIINGIFKTDCYNVKYCSPTFDTMTQELLGVRIQYKYRDQEELSKSGKEKLRWFRLDITDSQEILYDNPEVNEYGEAEPVFKVAQTIDHNFGFVPGEWVTNGEAKEKIDGRSILKDILEISDALNYQLSQSDQAITYTQEPQLAFKGMDQDEVDNLIKSSTKVWNLGREGEANFVEISGNGIKLSEDHQKGLSQRAQDLAKVVILDPERLSGVYQSGRAMEVMHAPLVDLIHEVRPWFGDYGIVPLTQKMIIAAVRTVEMGGELAITFPAGYAPKSLDIELKWKPVFEPTMEDIQKVVGIAVQASTANIITRATATKFVAEYFGITDVEAEQAAVIAQPLPPSPFGPFPM